jgi:hypothetical protein
MPAINAGIILRDSHYNTELKRTLRPLLKLNSDGADTLATGLAALPLPGSMNWGQLWASQTSNVEMNAP